ncbi:MAG: patatin-like phospholipase RssA [Ghiorsea sp.]|nr:patatin-like phospholipase RssA [Ghiorsea sp.]
MGQHLKIGLALGSGSARGWAHIGVLRELEKMGIKPDVISGCSIGALVGGAYASGHFDELEKWVSGLTWKEIVGFLDMSVMRGGVIRGEKLLDFARLYMQEKPIQALDMPFAAVATDLESGREVWLREGSLLEAVRASISLPGLFTPVQREGRWLVDGGLVDPVPVSLCRALGADVVIAVNLNGDLLVKHEKPKKESKAEREGVRTNDASDSLWERVSDTWKSQLGERKNMLLKQWLSKRTDAPGMFEVMYGSLNIMQDRITRSRLAGDPADVILEPRLGHIGLMDYDKAEDAIAEGRASVERLKPQLLALLH